MDKTRQSMSETVEEIKGELSQALKWQTYVRRYPGAFLIGGGVLGLMLGRAISGSDSSTRMAPSLPEGRPAAEQPGEYYAGGAADQSWQQPENPTLRRMADMMTSALIAQVVPILSNKLKRFLGAESSALDEAQAAPKKETWLH